MDKSDSFLLCMRGDEAPALIVPGSTKHRCAECNAWIWASPASLAVARQQGMTLLCMDCGEKRAQQDQDLEVKQPTAEQLQEMRETILKDLTERG
jgi:hypothetical protein